MTTLTTIAAVGGSLMMLAFLATTDPKRRRVFDQAPKSRPTIASVLAVILAITPGAMLLTTGQFASFVVWCGALSVTGWGLAAMPPKMR